MKVGMCFKCYYQIVNRLRKKEIGAKISYGKQIQMNRSLFFLQCNYMEFNLYVMQQRQEECLLLQKQMIQCLHHGGSRLH